MVRNALVKRIYGQHNRARRLLARHTLIRRAAPDGHRQHAAPTRVPAWPYLPPGAGSGSAADVSASPVPADQPFAGHELHEAVERVPPFISATPAGDRSDPRPETISGGVTRPAPAQPAAPAPPAPSADPLADLVRRMRSQRQPDAVGEAAPATAQSDPAGIPTAPRPPRRPRAERIVEVQPGQPVAQPAQPDAGGEQQSPPVAPPPVADRSAPAVENVAANTPGALPAAPRAGVPAQPAAVPEQAAPPPAESSGPAGAEQATAAPGAPPATPKDAAAANPPVPSRVSPPPGGPSVQATGEPSAARAQRPTMPTGPVAPVPPAPPPVTAPAPDVVPTSEQRPAHTPATSQPAPQAAVPPPDQPDLRATAPPRVAQPAPSASVPTPARPSEAAAEPPAPTDRSPQAWAARLAQSLGQTPPPQPDQPGVTSSPVPPPVPDLTSQARVADAAAKTPATTPAPAATPAPLFPAPVPDSLVSPPEDYSATTPPPAQPAQTAQPDLPAVALPAVQPGAAAIPPGQPVPAPASAGTDRPRPSAEPPGSPQAWAARLARHTQAVQSPPPEQSLPVSQSESPIEHPVQPDAASPPLADKPAPRFQRPQGRAATDNATVASATAMSTPEATDLTGGYAAQTSEPPGPQSRAAAPAPRQGAPRFVSPVSVTSPQTGPALAGTAAPAEHVSMPAPRPARQPDQPASVLPAPAPIRSVEESAAGEPAVVEGPEQADRAHWGSLPAPWETLPGWMTEPTSAASGDVQTGKPATTPGAGRSISPAAPAAGGGPVIQRAAGEPADTPAAVETPAPSAEEPDDQAPEADLDLLARQVYAVLKKRLSVERRRLG